MWCNKIQSHPVKAAKQRWQSSIIIKSWVKSNTSSHASPPTSLELSFSSSSSHTHRSLTFFLDTITQTHNTMSWFRNISKCYFSATKAHHQIHSNTNTHSLTLLSRFCTSTSDSGLVKYAGLGPTKPNEKPRVVVLGSGWAGCRLMKGLDASIYDIVCVSPRNHMVFTPLLASTCVGTLEFRSVAEPIARIQPAISNEPGSYFFLANCTGVDAEKHEVCSFDFSSNPW